MAKLDTLREFIEEQMRQRDMSAREFAALVGVTHATINKFVSASQKPDNPKMEFIIKLSDATHTRPSVLLALAYPEFAERERIYPASEFFNLEFPKLTEQQKEEVLALMRFMVSRTVASHSRNK